MKTPKIAIFTTFTYHAAGYSLVNLVRSQVRMLHRAGYEAHLILADNYPEKDDHNYKEATLHKIIPHGHLEDYREAKLQEKHQPLVDGTKDALIKLIDDLDINIILSHDVVFLGWHYPYALAVKEVSKERPFVKWMHWIHSVPSGFNPIWDIRQYGSAHKLVYPNRTDALRVGEQFQGRIEDVICIHHTKDLREFARFDDATNRFIDEYDLMSADIIQIYPASVDRLHAKGIEWLMRAFAAMKNNFHKSVRLVICNQWCTIDKHRKTVEEYLTLGETLGLKKDKDLIFTSRFEVDSKPNWEVGIPERMVSELMMLGNLFMFPTREESFGLVLPEASLMSGCLVICNASLDMMREVSGNIGIHWDFGSFHRDWTCEDKDAFFKGVAQIIIGKMMSESGIRMKTHFRQHFNMDYIMRTQLEPAMMSLINESI
jgi:glycosyltransferase involved in cell wall biosynthesis